MAARKRRKNMDKEQILQKSRKENKNKDIAELEVINQASGLAVRIGILVCCFISVAEVIATNQVNYSCWMIYFSMLATLFCVKCIKLRRKHEILLTIFFLICFFVMAACYIRHLMGSI